MSNLSVTIPNALCAYEQTSMTLVRIAEGDSKVAFETLRNSFDGIYDFFISNLYEFYLKKGDRAPDIQQMYKDFLIMVSREEKESIVYKLVDQFLYSKRESLSDQERESFNAFQKAYGYFVKTYANMCTFRRLLMKNRFCFSERETVFNDPQQNIFDLINTTQEGEGFS